jgi:hypothetical protein
MKRRIVLASVVCVIVVVTIATAFWLRSKDTKNPVETMLGGIQVVETLREPDRVEAYRLKPVDFYGELQQSTVADFSIESGPIDVPREIRTRVSTALLADDSYGWDYAKPCVPRYGVRLTFIRGTERVDILFCFECDTLAVFHNDSVSGGEDFDPARPIFVKAVKVLFPQDKVIQKLKAKKR